MIKSLKKISLGILFTSSLVFTGCDSSSGTAEASEGSILEYLAQTNKSFGYSQLAFNDLCQTERDATTVTDWNNTFNTFNATKDGDFSTRIIRFDYENEKIPVYFIGSADSRFTYAINYIENLLGDIFADPIIISDVTYFDSAISTCNAITTTGDTFEGRERFVAEGEGGIVFSLGTAYVPDGSTDYANYCANASNYLNASQYENPYTSNATFTTRKLTFLNIDNIGCTSSNMIVVHEVAHAIGLLQHFSDYGLTDSWGSTTESVLKTLYFNSPNTPYTDAVVY